MNLPSLPRVCFENPFHCRSRRKEARVSKGLCTDKSQNQSLLTSAPTILKHSLNWLVPVLFLLILLPASGTLAAEPASPLKILFDTDIGNDVDDVLALSMLHALQTRGDCELLAVTITKPDELAGPFVDAMDTFYGRPGIPIGFTRSKLKNDPSKFLGLAEAKNGGKLRYPHRLKRSSEAPAATDLLRKILSQQPDQSVTMVQVGYFSNLAALLDTPEDKYSPLAGRDLVRAKVKLLSVMAGAFQPVDQNKHYLEYNV